MAFAIFYHFFLRGIIHRQKNCRIPQMLTPLEKLTNRHEKGRDAAVLPAVTIDLTKVTWTGATAVMSTDIVQ